MTRDEWRRFETDIVRVAARTNAIVFHRIDSEGGVEYALFPRDRMDIEHAVVPRGKRRRRRRD